MIDASSLARHFPVHAIIGPGMELLQIGSVLRRLAGTRFAASCCFDEIFEIERPKLQAIDLDLLRSLGPKLCLLRFKPNGMRIRSEFVAASDGSVVMLGGAGVTSTGELGRLGLALNDFTAHDPTVDFLMAVTTHRATLDELKELTGVLESQKEKLEQSNRMLASATAEARLASEMKSRFLSKISHELRNPLHAIAGFCKLLLDKDGDGRREEYLDAIEGSAELLVSIVGKILDLAKIEAGRLDIRKTAFDPRALFGRIMKLYEGQARVKDLDFIYRIHMDDNIWLDGDPSRIGQIVMNLAGNAVKFTERGGIEFVVTWTDGLLRVDVKDTGPGIAGGDLTRIFQPFVQVGQPLKREEGTGLGLAISLELAALMGGTLTVSSDGRSGSLFRLELPARLAASPDPESAPVPVLPAPRRVLVVDDSEVNRLVGQKLLERDGHSVKVASNGEEALAMIALDEPDVVLMDIQMPGLDGLDTLREIRRQGFSVPVIALTANAACDDREHSIAAGMHGYLTKPLDLETLRSTLRAL